MIRAPFFTLKQLYTCIYFKRGKERKKRGNIDDAARLFLTHFVLSGTYTKYLK